MRCVLLPLVLLAACEKGPDADLPLISEARSLGAEWALVNQEAANNRLTDPYASTMRKQLRAQLEELSTSLTFKDSRYGAEIRALDAEPANAAPGELKAHVDQLKQIEDDLESA